MYGVSNQGEEFSIYILTSKKYRKTKNLQNNAQITFIIPFPHHYFRFVPSATITLNGLAEVLPINNESLVKIFEEKRILRLIVKDIDYKNDDQFVFVKIKPEPRILCYGTGINIFKLRNSHTRGGYSVNIPEARR